MRASVVVRSKDEADRLRLTLVSLACQSELPEVVVVNDGSSDHTEQVLDEMRSELGGPNFDPHNHTVLVEGPPIMGLPEGMLAGFGWVKHIDDREASERVYDVVISTHPSTRKLGLERMIVGRLMEIARGILARDDLAR